MAEFQNLEIDPERTFCFGYYQRNDGNGWRELADASVTKGWKGIDADALQRDLAVNVNASYGIICQTEITDLDSGMRYAAAFDNDAMMWKLGIKDSPEADILPEQAAAFFASEYVVKFAVKCADYIAKAVKTYRGIVEPHLLNGELPDVPVVKLDRLLFIGDNARSMDNIRRTKYMLS